MAATQQDSSRGKAFSRGLGLLITAIGAVAILGPEAAHVLVAQTLGLLLAVTGLLGLASLLSRAPGAPTRAILTWALVALVVGAALLLKPFHGLASAGALIGLLLLGHSAATAAVILRRWRSLDAFVVLGCVAATFLAMVGLAILFGEKPGDQIEEILIGADMVMFGAYLILGRGLIGSAPSSGRSPSTS